MGRARRGGTTMAVASAIVLGAAAWSTATLERGPAASDPYASIDEQLARGLHTGRADLHATVGEVRAADPATVGLEALNDLADATGRRFRFRALDGDGTTHAEVTLAATHTRSFVKYQESWWTSVCLSLVVEPGRDGGRGSVTTAQIRCAPDAPPPPPGSRSEDGGPDGDPRPATVVLERVRTGVPAPSPRPARPPVCYSGSPCEEVGG